MGAYSEEQAERCHPDFERRYQGQHTESVIRDYIWGLIKGISTKHNRKDKTFIFKHFNSILKLSL